MKYREALIHGFVGEHWNRRIRPLVHRRQIVLRHFCLCDVVSGFKWECVHRHRHDKNVSQLLMRLVKFYNSSKFVSHDWDVTRVFKWDCAHRQLVCRCTQHCDCIIPWPHLVGANTEHVYSLIVLLRCD
jgi:hypothetical protein